MKITIFQKNKIIKEMAFCNSFKKYFNNFKKQNNINDNTYKCRILKNNFFNYEAWELVNLATNKIDFKITFKFD